MPRQAAVDGLALAGLVLLLAWVAGLGWFLYRVTLPVALPDRADGIVALTGGADRVETALRLLAAGRADRLLVSGIGGGTDLGMLAHRAGLEAAPLAARVTLGRNATSTRGNATETAGWARAHDIRSLIVVTAAYHMPRALTEIARALPGVTLYPQPVRPVQREISRLSAARLLLAEYTKFIIASLDLTWLAPVHEAASYGHTA